MIYAIGDSHTRIVEGEPGFSGMYHALIKDLLKAPTAHNLIKKGSTSRMREKILDLLPKVDKKKDVLLFSFGELDCRVHIYRQHVKKGVSVSRLVDNTIKNYAKFVEEIAGMGYRVCLLGVPPCGRQGNKFKFDYYPIPIQQAEIFKLFNDRMRKRFPDIYIDMYTPTADANGFIAKEYVRDDTHINKKAFPFLVQALKEFGIDVSKH